MTAADEQAALLRAIITQPDEDTPRLAYADWLDENSQGEADIARAELIRVQCEFANLDPVNKSCPLIHDYGMSKPRWEEGVCQCRGCVLYRRDRELVSAHSAAWQYILCPVCKGESEFNFCECPMCKGSGNVYPLANSRLIYGQKDYPKGLEHKTSMVRGFWVVDVRLGHVFSETRRAVLDEQTRKFVGIQDFNSTWLQWAQRCVREAISFHDTQSQPEESINTPWSPDREFLHHYTWNRSRYALERGLSCLPSLLFDELKPQWRDQDTARYRTLDAACQDRDRALTKLVCKRTWGASDHE